MKSCIFLITYLLSNKTFLKSIINKSNLLLSNSYSDNQHHNHTLNQIFQYDHQYLEYIYVLFLDIENFYIYSHNDHHRSMLRHKYILNIIVDEVNNKRNVQYLS